MSFAKSSRKLPLSSPGKKRTYIQDPAHAPWLCSWLRNEAINKPILFVWSQMAPPFLFNVLVNRLLISGSHSPMEKMASTGIMANLEAIRRVLRQNGTGLLSYYQQTGQLVIGQ